MRFVDSLDIHTSTKRVSAPPWKFSDTALQTQHGLTFDFYTRLPHIKLHSTTHNNGEHEEETRDGRSTRQKEGWNDGGKCTSIYCTHIMANLHAIVVNSFVFRATPPSH